MVVVVDIVGVVVVGVCVVVFVTIVVVISVVVVFVISVVDVAVAVVVFKTSSNDSTSRRCQRGGGEGGAGGEGWEGACLEKNQKSDGLSVAVLVAAVTLTLCQFFRLRRPNERLFFNDLHICRQMID